MSYEASKPEKEKAVVEKLNKSGLFDAKTVGPNTVSAISIMGEKEVLAGNVLRRLCKLGDHVARTEMDPRPDKNPCQEGCLVHRQLIELANRNIEQKCADENLVEVVSELGVRPENVFMIGVTADSVGFADEVDANPEKYPYKINPKTGIKELAGFNAFFARESDTIAGDEVMVLGRRLADCGDINLEFTDKDGNRVMGFMHMTKGNLQGEGAQKFDYSGQKAGSFEYFLRTAMDHYSADLSNVRVRVAAAIRPENYLYFFKNGEAQMEDPKDGFPGWKNMLNEKGERFIRNRNNPEWEPGQSFDSSDGWTVDFEAMLRWQIAQVDGLKPDQVNWEDAIDPGDQGSPHASNTRGKVNPDINGRDAYFTAWVDKLKA